MSEFSKNLEIDMRNEIKNKNENANEEEIDEYEYFEKAQKRILLINKWGNKIEFLLLQPELKKDDHAMKCTTAVLLQVDMEIENYYFIFF